ncbi:MAG: hypothetical protein SH856_09440 [Flavobacteriales bacterium]|nr:hypothetical protein [Flavobacteriales bacterium]
MIFRPVLTTSSKSAVKQRVYKKLIQKPYSDFEGKIIRYIKIETLDPFGHTIADTAVGAQNIFLRTGNKLHIKSQSITIRNLLLIRQNQIFDSLLVKESERLVRSQGYIRDVSFFVRAISENSDSVDIIIRELDRWSIIPKGDFSNSRLAIQLNDKNFLGMGHEFKNAYTWYHNTGKDAYNTSYSIPNIRNTYINTTLNYGTDEFQNFTKSISADRPFFSPFAKWAAGIRFTQQFKQFFSEPGDSLYLIQNFKYNSQDYWAGNAMQIFRGNSENNRTTNFISAIRFLRKRHLEMPSVDTLQIYSDESFYLAGIGITTRKFVQDKFIFNWGVTEDVPIGKAYGLTGGYQEKNNTGRLYLGARISMGNYYPWGYLSSNYEYGCFFRNAHAQQGVFSVGLIYFTGLAQLGKWNFRQFAKIQMSLGINRFSFENLSINDGEGIDGFNGSALDGTNRLLCKLQTQSYAPWNLIGFRFGPYLIYSLGILGDAATGFKRSKAYSQIGLGVLIRNDNLVFNTFQFSISFYPVIPGTGQDIFKLNSFKTTDFGFGSFNIGKPATAAFQ